MTNKIKKEKCEHLFIPAYWTQSNEVYGINSDEEEILLEHGFMIVSCQDCGIEGYCLLDK